MKFRNLLIASLICGGLLAVTAPTQAQKQTTLRDFYNNSHSAHSEVLNQRNGIKDVQQKFNSHRNFVTTQPAQQSAQTQSRLKAFGFKEYDGVMTIPMDSLRLFYSGSRSNPGIEYLLMDMFIYYPSITPHIPTIDSDVLFNTDSVYSFSWDASNDVFELISKGQITFDANGNILSDVFLVFDGSNWQPIERRLYTYNSQGLYTSIIRQNWSGAIWENDDKKEYTYDSQNNITEYIQSYWHNSSSTWNGSQRTIATYEGSKMSSIISQWGSGGTWNNSWRGSMNYTGNLIAEYYEDYWSGGSWVKGYKIINTYNSNDQLTAEKYMNWDGSDYMNESRVLYNYDQGVCINSIQQEWDGSNWQYDYKEEYEYLYGKVNRVTAAQWDGSQFQNTARLSYNNNSYGQPTEASVEETDGSEWSLAVGGMIINFFYEDFEAGATGITEKLKKDNLNIYPNPASRFINVELNGQNINYIKIVDITGKVVFETNSSFSSSEVQIPIEQLENGVYILHVSSGNQGSASKFIVNR